MQVGSFQDVAVATPERVSVSLPVAGVGYRALAYLIDATLLFLGWIALYFGLTLLVSDIVGLVEGLSGLVQSILVLSVFAMQWLYWTGCEVAMGGQTPGKRILRIRVVREDGSPVGFFESATRNLCRAVDFLPIAYAAGVTTMLLNRQNRRLGDLLAGTLLIREQKIDLDRYVAVAQIVEAQPVDAAPVSAALPAADLELVLSYLERAPGFLPEARARIARKLVERLGAQLPADERATATANVEAMENFLRQRTQVRG